MKVYVPFAFLSSLGETSGFAPSSPLFGIAKTRGVTELAAEIRPPTEKSKELRFGWDGSSALGGAVDDSQPARMLDEIREAGETLSETAELFNSNLEMSGDSLQFEEFLEMVDECYEFGMIQFKNGDVVNAPGENDGSAKVLSYAALAEFDESTTLKLWGQYYREVLADPEGDSHSNIRNFMKTGWKGVPFENGIALTKKNFGENEWDPYAESWIP
eukprot:CAMPEP_0194288788 /NCGR_PEP_ID=MMETSP0169-20130528/37617_1 /TAXON_ID=218684 /ORGANISM="Corethron pennatum, Strain L29A3" /LENGTH=215 /DNA_ID=CAMNT_0039035889 /DNA_START=19 /DNA_END=666 /DNA_ORIENTATION=+